ncbi:hypothetical protein AB0L83_33700 [Streptomyces sp. NPDC052071]|uniref:hypothetical protein n=1 Tax=Streptomyces sp. NPDC052071 TaxID=3156666 RepID=UPI00341CC32F
MTEELGVHRDTAQDALLRLRADRIAHLMLTDPSLTPEQSAATRPDRSAAPPSAPKTVSYVVRRARRL